MLKKCYTNCFVTSNRDGHAFILRFIPEPIKRRLVHPVVSALVSRPRKVKHVSLRRGQHRLSNLGSNRCQVDRQSESPSHLLPHWSRSRSYKGQVGRSYCQIWRLLCNSAQLIKTYPQANRPRKIVRQLCERVEGQVPELWGLHRRRPVSLFPR